MKIRMSVLAFCAVIMLSACAPTAQPKAVDPAQKEFKIGDTVNLEGFETTVTKVEKSKGSEYDKPRSGNEFVIVHIELKNNSSKQVSYDPSNYKMSNSKGQITDIASTMVDQDTYLSYGDLASGGSIEGTLAFEQPKNDKKLQLQYTDYTVYKVAYETSLKINLQ